MLEKSWRQRVESREGAQKSRVGIGAEPAAKAAAEEPRRQEVKAQECAKVERRRKEEKRRSEARESNK